MFHDTLVPCAERRNINMKKEYDADILKAFSQSYFAGILVNVREDRYEVLHLASWMRHISKEGSYTEFLEEMLNDSIMQDYQGQLREKLDPSYIKKTLNEDELTEIDRSYYIDYKVIREEQRRWCRASVVIVDLCDDGSPNHVLVLFKDITKQKEKDMEYQRTLKEAYQLAERANQAKTTFLNNMSHDIRTPMNAIIGFTSLAATHIDEKERLKDYLSKIMTSSNHLLSLINDVLDMSRIESGKVKIEESPCSIPIVIHDLRNILQTDIKAKRLDFFIDTVDVVDENVICDKLRLNQILLNCMSNAMKYTKAGGTVGFRIIQKGHAPEGFADYDFVVKDNGIGMSEEFAEHIFEPFTREETSTVSRIPGTGLGMAITKNIVDMMGGTIKVKSELGVGSEFTISLRFKTTQQNSKRGVIKELNGFRALVADDSMDSCASVEKMLRTIGLRSEWTTSGKEAIFRAKYASQEKDPFQVYIIDWLMPDMNGIEVVRRIRMEIGDEVPIIILTAYDWADIEQEAREAGVTAFCAKPLFVSELYDVLQNASRPVKTKDKTILEVEAFKGKEILLVEDVELNREIAETILTEAGFHVNSVEDGKQAVDYMESEKGNMIDLILMDVMMPVMDGYEATQKIRQLEDKTKADIPIIAMTANAFEEDAKRCLAAGMTAHLAKPFQIEDVEKAIVECCGK